MAELGDEFSEFRRKNLGGAQLLPKWAEMLRGLASDLDTIASHRGMEEHTALFLAKGAVRATNAKMNGYKDSRSLPFRR